MGLGSNDGSTTAFMAELRDCIADLLLFVDSRSARSFACVTAGSSLHVRT
jgi:hypothetical protein